MTALCRTGDAAGRLRVRFGPALIVRSALGLSFVLLIFAATASAVEHPGTLPKAANCASCHADKIKGKSVHSAMAMACTVCHLTKTEGDLTTTTLAMPKDQFCFSCHEKAEELAQHKPTVKEQCLNCHDAHSSDQRMLLRDKAHGFQSSARIAQQRKKRAQRLSRQLLRTTAH